MNEQMKNVVVAVLLGGLLYVAGQYVASEPGREQQAVESGREITVTGQGKASVRPTIAEVTVGTQTNPLPTAEAALAELTESFNGVVDAVKGLGIAEADIQTSNFFLNPTYDFVEGRQVLRGFTASEQITVKVRDLEKVGEVISQATQTGANQVGGVNFQVDEQEEVQAQAEEEAIAQARTKAERIAGALGANLGDVKRYEVSTNGTPPPIAFRELAADSAAGSAVPQVPAGTDDIEVTVTVTFQLR